MIPKNPHVLPARFGSPTWENPPGSCASAAPRDAQRHVSHGVGDAGVIHEELPALSLVLGTQTPRSGGPLRWGGGGRLRWELSLALLLPEPGGPWERQPGLAGI